MAGVEPVLGAPEPARPALRGRGLGLRGMTGSVEPTIVKRATRVQESIEEIHQIFMGSLTEHHALDPGFSIEDVCDTETKCGGGHWEYVMAYLICAWWTVPQCEECCLTPAWGGQCEGTRLVHGHYDAISG